MVETRPTEIAPTDEAANQLTTTTKQPSVVFQNGSSRDKCMAFAFCGCCLSPPIKNSAENNSTFEKVAPSLIFLKLGSIFSSQILIHLGPKNID
jgi:hypothetical protein